MFAPLPTPEEMARWDRTSIDGYGLRNEMLMENASREALHVLRTELGRLAGLNALVFAGPGNNGGDAFALARHLHDQGALVHVIHTKPASHYKRASGYHLRLARKVGVPTLYLSYPNPAALSELPFPDLVIDGLLGTGFSGPLRNDMPAWIDLVNELGGGAFVLAVDIPSGLDGLSGRPSPVAVAADATVAFEAVKIGLALPEAAAYVGRVHVRPIGIPRRVLEETPPSFCRIEPEIIDCLPAPSATMHKGQAGHVLIIGGAEGLTGAPLLAALGALRGGAGLVTIACPAGLAAEIKAGVPEVMTLSLAHGRDWKSDMAGILGREMHRFDALVLGPGLGRAPETAAFVDALLSQERPPAVLDADCLYWLSKHPQLMNTLRSTDILTPHPGEMQRLLLAEEKTPSKAATTEALERLRTAAAFVAHRPFTLILKGAYSVAACAGRPAALSPFAAPALATGGAGDVLAGLVGSLLGRGLSALPAACLGLYWHGYAGVLLGRTYPNRGNLAGEIAHILPHALEELYNAQRKRHHDPESRHSHP